MTERLNNNSSNVILGEKTVFKMLILLELI